MPDPTRPTTAELIAAMSYPDAAHGVHFSAANAAAIAADLAELEAIRAACDDVASDNIAAIVGEDATNDEWPRWVILNESGDPMLTADSPAALIRALEDKWADASDLAENMEAAAHDLRREAERLRAAVADVRLLDENPPAMSDAPRHWNNGEACAWLDGYGAGVADAIKPLTRALDHGGADGER